MELEWQGHTSLTRSSRRLDRDSINKKGWKKCLVSFEFDIKNIRMDKFEWYIEELIETSLVSLTN